MNKKLIYQYFGAERSTGKGNGCGVASIVFAHYAARLLLDPAFIRPLPLPTQGSGKPAGGIPA